MKSFGVKKKTDLHILYGAHKKNMFCWLLKIASHLNVFERGEFES